MCNHRNPAHRSGGCPQSFLPLPLSTEPHGHLAKYHHRYHKVSSPQGASPRALGLALGFSTRVGSAPQSRPSCAHACTCTCPCRPQKREAWVLVVLHHLLRDGCEESSYEVNQKAYNNPPVLTTRDPEASLVPSKEKKGSAHMCLASPDIALLYVGKEKSLFGLNI